jgi:hypothetical protein
MAFWSLLDHPQQHIYNASHLVIRLANREITAINPLKIYGEITVQLK